MIQSKYLLTILFIATFFILIIVPFATGLLPVPIATPIDSPYESRDARAESGESQMNPAKSTSTTAIVVTATVTAQPDARLLLEKHCYRCHIPQWLDQFEEPRTEWESILVQMERMGVNLSEIEKVVLLEYLASIVEP